MHHKVSKLPSYTYTFAASKPKAPFGGKAYRLKKKNTFTSNLVWYFKSSLDRAILMQHVLEALAVPTSFTALGSLVKLNDNPFPPYSNSICNSNSFMAHIR